MKTCLAKNPDERWQAAGDVRRQLEWIAANARSAATETTAGSRVRRQLRLMRTLALLTSLVALIIVGGLSWYVWTGPSAPSRIIRTTIVTSGVAALSLRAGRTLAITPDRTRVVYIGSNGTQLFDRPIDRLESKAILTGNVPLYEVFISPNGESVGFVEGNTIKTMALAGGPIRTIVPGIAGYGATWAPDDTIIFPTTDPGSGLQRVSAAGGDVTMLTQPAAGELTHIWPAMLPGGRAVLFTITAATGRLDAAQIAVFDLVTRTKKVLVPGGSDARYVTSGLGSLKRPDRGGGYLVYVKGSALMAIAFDPTRLETTGTPVTVLPRLATGPIGSGDFDVANDGTLVYVDPPADASTAARRLVWVDRAGHETPLSASLPARPYFQPRVSPDQTQIAVAIDDEEKDIWVWDVARQKLRPLTSGPALDIYPVWTTDSRRLIFAGDGLFWQAANGTGMREALKGSRMLPSGVTPDGTRLLFSRAPADGADVMAMVLDTGLVESLVETPSDERNGVVSADSHWLAYESNSTGHFAIYVKPYPSVNAGGWTISTEGTRPLWAPNSQELFFVAPDGAIMSVRVDPRGGALNADSPVKIFKGPYATGDPASGRNYDVSRDGKRFLMVKPVPTSQADAPQIRIVQHWDKELKHLVPTTP